MLPENRGISVEAIEGARNCAVNLASVNQNEQVLIVSHGQSDPRIAKAIAQVCGDAGAKVREVSIREAHGSGIVTPPRAVLDAMDSSDVIFSNVIMESTEARAKGARYVGLYMADIGGLTSPGARLHAEIIFKICELATEQWKRGRTITITCSKGSNLTARILKRSYAFGHIPGPLKPGEFVNFCGGFGGLCLWPGWTGDGVIFFDVVTTFLDRAKVPLKWTVKDGRVVKVEGQKEHVEFINDAIRTGGKDSDHYAEIMIGLCPTARIRMEDMFAGLHFETERHAGVMHNAVGSSTDFYNEDGSPKPASVRPTNHLDCMNLTPTIKIDDEVSVDNGRLTLLDHPEVRELARKHNATF